MPLVIGPPAWWSEAKRSIRASDQLLGAVIDRHEEPPLRGAGDIVATLMNSIVGQQISGAAAAAIKGRLMTALGGVFEHSRMEPLDAEAMRAVGLSRSKARYLRRLAAEAEALHAFDWSAATEQQVEQRLLALPGVGPWTLHMVRIFALLEPDVYPLGDIGVVRAVEQMHAGGERLEMEELGRIGEAWRPWRTCATWYLWRLRDADPIEY